MGEFKLKKWVAAGLIVAMPYASVGYAAGLGRLNVLSQLGQPFSAEIDLVNVSKEELATLKASLASPAAYQSANLTFDPALNALRLSVERRSNGASYIKLTSFRAVAEPFLDLLIEFSWAGGKIVREYSALLDPPGMDAPAPAVTAPAVATRAVEAPAAPKPSAAVETPAPAKPAPVAQPVPAASRAARGSQITVNQGDTLYRIASGVKPEGISLEQTMMGLYRANPDAFNGNNINRLRAGRILNVPERELLAAVAQGDAAQEVRVHASNWNSYRQKVADGAQLAPDAAPVAKGRITARVEDKAAPAGAKDVVVLSKGGDAVAAAEGKGGKTGADRVRALEEDLAARDKTLAELRDRVALLEKTLTELRKLGEIKKQTPDVPGKAVDTKAETKAPPKPEAKVPDVPKPATKAPEVAKSEPPPKTVPSTTPPAPSVQKKAVTPPPPPPPPEPDLMDTVMDNIVPIGVGAAALLVGIGGFWALRRRKKNADVDGEPAVSKFRTEPFTGNADSGAASLALAAPVATVSNVSDVVDPIDEAQVYIDHGRDAQAEEILKEAMGKQPRREDIPLKLLEVYATRGDKNAFNSVATGFHELTAGVGANWGRAAAMGYALDPANSLYPSTGEVVDLAVSHRSSAPDVDLDLGGGSTEGDPLATTTDIELDRGGTGADVDLNRAAGISQEHAKTVTLDAAPPMVDFNIELPPASVPAAPEVQPATSNMLEFNLDLPAASAPASAKPVAAPAAKADSGGLDFKVDFSGIDLNLDDAKPAAAPAAAAGAPKDAQWEDVQQKFDLARAYQEMGDKEGAVEILHEVEREGDAEQKVEAQKLLQSLK